MDDADPFAWLCGGEDVLALRPSRVPLGSLLAEDAAFACSEDPGFLLRVEDDERSEDGDGGSTDALGAFFIACAAEGDPAPPRGDAEGAPVRSSAGGEAGAKISRSPGDVSDASRALAAPPPSRFALDDVDLSSIARAMLLDDAPLTAHLDPAPRPPRAATPPADERAPARLLIADMETDKDERSIRRGGASRTRAAADPASTRHASTARAAMRMIARDKDRDVERARSLANAAEGSSDPLEPTPAAKKPAPPATKKRPNSGGDGDDDALFPAPPPLPLPLPPSPPAVPSTAARPTAFSSASAVTARTPRTNKPVDKCVVAGASPPAGRSSRYRGVTKHRWTGRFEAHLWDADCDRVGAKPGQRKKGRQVYLGGYASEAEAARAYDVCAIKYWGDAAHLNFDRREYGEAEVAEIYATPAAALVAKLRRTSSGFARGASRFRGVTRHHQHGRWEARIGRVFGNRYLYLGTFPSEEDAARAYDRAALEHRGPKAVTNFPREEYANEGTRASRDGGEGRRKKTTIGPTGPLSRDDDDADDRASEGDDRRIIDGGESETRRTELDGGYLRGYSEGEDAQDARDAEERRGAGDRGGALGGPPRLLAGGPSKRRFDDAFAPARARRLGPPRGRPPAAVVVLRGEDVGGFSARFLKEATMLEGAVVARRESASDSRASAASAEATFAKTS